MTKIYNVQCTLIIGDYNEEPIHLLFWEIAGSTLNIYRKYIYTINAVPTLIFSEPVGNIVDSGGSGIGSLSTYLSDIWTDCTGDTGEGSGSGSGGSTSFVPQATDTNQGIAELATNTEALAGVDTERIITPAALAYVLGQYTGYNNYAATIAGNDVTSSFVVTHGFNSNDVIAQVYDITTGENIIVDIDRNTVNQVTVNFTLPPGTGETFRVLVSK